MSHPIQTEWSGHHPAKDQLRAEIWALLKEQSAVWRDPVGHIPNVVGAAAAAARLATLPIWHRANTIKCNPDKPQRSVRLQALHDGKVLYMAVPRLTRRQCFVELDPAALCQRGIAFNTAASMTQALKVGRFVSFEEMRPIDLVVVGCVAVTRDGGRTGKGAGFADLELALLQDFNLLSPETPIMTTVHPLQIVDTDRLLMSSYDWALDWIITPDTVIEMRSRHPRPAGLDWQKIRPEQYRKIPILRSLYPPHASSN